MGTVLSYEDALVWRKLCREEKKTVVFTNGVFDLLHRGHCEYLAKAASFGDVLIVGMNTDASVRRIKGENKPIVPQEDRAYVLSALRAVDVVAFFDEDTPRRIIAGLLPDILVKGADYALDQIVGREEVENAGGSVHAIALTPEKSSTNILQTIVDRYCK